MKSTRKKWKDCQRAAFVLHKIYLVATAAVGIHFVIHPRPQKIFIFLFLLILTLQIGKRMTLEKYMKDEKKNDKFMQECMIGGPIAVWILLVALSPLELVMPNHMIWEYRGEMAEMQERFYENYYYFPEKIPKGAKQFSWKVYPGYMQGKSFKRLSFVADEQFIKSEVEGFLEEGAEALTFEEMEYQGKVPGFTSEIPENRKKYIRVYLMKYADNPEEYPYAQGVFVDEEKNRIYYFLE